MQLIGIAGQKRSGKGEVAGFIKDWAKGEGLPVKERGFSDMLKWSAYRLFKPDCTMADALAWETDFKTNGHVHSKDGNIYRDVSGRVFLQRYGTEAHRDIFGEDFWLDQLLPLTFSDSKKLRTNFDNSAIGIISDLRFDNEAERIIELGGAVWQVDRQIQQNDAHTSEKGIDPELISCHLDNSAGLPELRLQVENEVAALLEDHKLQLRMQV